MWLKLAVLFWLRFCQALEVNDYNNVNTLIEHEWFGFKRTFWLFWNAGLSFFIQDPRGKKIQMSQSQTATIIWGKSLLTFTNGKWQSQLKMCSEKGTWFCTLQLLKSFFCCGSIFQKYSVILFFLLNKPTLYNGVYLRQQHLPCHFMLYFLLLDRKVLKLCINVFLPKLSSPHTSPQA